MNWLKRKIEKLINKFGYGFCIYCGELANEKARFSDDADGGNWYWEFCHEECYTHMLGEV